MFTINQIKQAHTKVKSGADFPEYIQNLITLGVTRYESFVTDGHVVYEGAGDFKTQSDAKYPSLHICDESDNQQFQKDLKEHQLGKTDYLTFCGISAKLGVEKWIVDMSKMTCIYYDKAGKKMLKEIIPSTR